MRKEYLDKFINIKTEILTAINNAKRGLFKLEKGVIIEHFSNMLDKLKNLTKWNLDNKENKNGYNNLPDLTPEENKEMMNLVKESKKPNTINYLKIPTYKKYLNIIERTLNLPKYTLECVCFQESRGKLYDGNNLIGSHKGAQGLFQFIPSTARQYMTHNKLKEKYGRTFTSRYEFLKDPLASAWAAGIMYSELMHKHNYNLQTSLACYNRGIGRYEKRIGKRNLRPGDLEHLPKETRNYVKDITNDVLSHNGASCNNILLADLGQYSRTNKNENVDGVFTA